MLNAQTTGDMTTRVRHDPIKHTIVQFMKDSGGFARAECYDYLAPVIPAANLATLDQEPLHDARKRLITPDIIGTVGVRGREQYIEIKSLGLNDTWYPPQGNPAGPNYGVAKRASDFRADIVRRARALDIKLGLARAAVRGAPPPPPGPCEQKIRAAAPITVVCVGGLGEGSPDLHCLLKAIAAAAAAKMQDELGMQYKAAKARVTEYLYRDLGVVVARGMARMILERRRFAGPIRAHIAAHFGQTTGAGMRRHVAAIVAEERDRRGSSSSSGSE